MSKSSKVQAAGLLVYKVLEEKVFYLLLQTSYGKHHWTPPKGHVDPGEDTFAAAMREAEEEAGLSCADLILEKDVKITLSYFDPTKKGQKSVHFWLARLRDSERAVKLSNEHQAFKWAELEEAKRLADFPEQHRLLTEADQYLRSRSSS